MLDQASNQGGVTKYYVVPQATFFMYSSRAGLNPNEMLTTLKMEHGDLNDKLGGYLLSRQQYAALLYKCGVKKVELVATEMEEELLGKVDTSLLIEELESRTRK